MIASRLPTQKQIERAVIQAQQRYGTLPSRKPECPVRGGPVLRVRCIKRKQIDWKIR